MARARAHVLGNAAQSCPRRIPLVPGMHAYTGSQLTHTRAAAAGSGLCHLLLLPTRVTEKEQEVPTRGLSGCLMPSKGSQAEM